MIPAFFMHDFFLSTLNQREIVSDLAFQAFWIISIGIYFELQAQTTCFFSIGMGESSIILISFGTATAIFLPMVLVSTIVYDGGFLAVCICTAIHLFLRFVVATICVNYMKAFKEANKMSFFCRETF